MRVWLAMLAMGCAVSVDEPMTEPEPTAPGVEGPIPEGGGIRVAADCTMYEHHRLSAGPMVRVVSAQTSVSEGLPEGHVHYAVDEPVILVLDSDAHLQWEVTESFPGSIRRILVTRPPEAVDGPVVAETLDGTAGGSQRYSDVAVSALEGSLGLLGLELGSFHACRGGSRWSFEPQASPNPVEPRPECGQAGVPDGAREWSWAEHCPELAEEARTCLSWQEVPVVIGLDEGTTCPLPFEPGDNRSSTVGWGGRWLYHCDGERSLARTDLQTGEVTHAYLPVCDAPIAVSGGLIVAERFYASFLDAQCGRGQERFAPALGAIGVSDEGVMAGGGAFTFTLYDVALPSLESEEFLLEGAGVVTSAERMGDRIYTRSRRWAGGATYLTIHDAEWRRTFRELQLDGDLAGLACSEKP